LSKPLSQGTTVDYLIRVDKYEKVKATLKDTEPLIQFKAVEQFSDDVKTVGSTTTITLYYKKTIATNGVVITSLLYIKQKQHNCGFCVNYIFLYQEGRYFKSF
jgi:hypothetical protein